MKKDEMVITVSCRMCNTVHGLTVKKKDYEEYMSYGRRHIQDIFPYLNPDERELLISGICPDCWNKMFAMNEEDYFDDEEEWEEYQITPEDYEEWSKASGGII